MPHLFVLARRLVILGGMLALPPAVGAANTGVTLNGTPLPKAHSTIDSAIQITEFRSGGDAAACPTLLPGCPSDAVCIVSPTPIAPLDARFPKSETVNPPMSFTVGVEDGREFQGCLMSTLKAEGDGAKRRYTYCLRCADVTVPSGGPGG
jgi:hypothetical protein